MTERQVARHWVIQVNGTVQARIEPGDGIEIGRKPLRPLASDGFTRIEIADETRSMSKRHALFIVNAQGEASVRDLDSTNGSFAVDTTGRLTRLPAGADFPLETPSARIQFGDVPVDFVRADHMAQGRPAPAVSDLFGGAPRDAEGKQEPDPAQMSVDEILDLRAGEPTSVFDAENIQRHIRRKAVDALTDIPALNGSGAAEVSAEPGESGNATASGNAAGSGNALVESAQSGISPGAPAEEMSLNVMQPGMQAEVQPRDLFADAQADASEGESVAPHKLVEMPESSDQAQPETPAHASDDSASEYSQAVAADQAVQAAQGSQPDGMESFEPAFEPGSVFERVSRGEFENREPHVEVEGFTSDDAKHSNDFTVQFDMARYPQLLPFLAMNPALYDDLYAWLAAQGNQDIDAALSRNEGYAEYLAHTGKRTE